MSNAPPPPGGPPRQPVSYSNPAGYMPASTMGGSQYGYSPGVATSQPDPYRSNPMASHPNPIPLPSIRSMDPMQAQSAPMQHSMGFQMLPQGYYLGPNAYLPQDQGMPRFALPHDPRLLGPRGPKKV